MSEPLTSADWRDHGVRVIRSGELDTNTLQTPGMLRAAAITHARVGAQKLWAGVRLPPSPMRRRSRDQTG